jgi:hypothetical protein
VDALKDAWFKFMPQLSKFENQFTNKTKAV